MNKNSEQSNNGSGKPPENDQGMGLQEIINMGQEAARTLGSQSYQLAHRIAVDQAVMEWASTQPKEREKRESLYQEVQALGRVADVMKGCVERAQQVLQNQEQQDNYLDRQGFGLDGQENTYQ